MCICKEDYLNKSSKAMLYVKESLPSLIKITKLRSF